MVNIGFPTSMLERLQLPEGAVITDGENGEKEIKLQLSTRNSIENEQEEFPVRAINTHRVHDVSYGIAKPAQERGEFHESRVGG